VRRKQARQVARVRMRVHRSSALQPRLDSHAACTHVTSIVFHHHPSPLPCARLTIIRYLRCRAHRPHRLSLWPQGRFSAAAFRRLSPPCWRTPLAGCPLPGAGRRCYGQLPYMPHAARYSRQTLRLADLYTWHLRLTIYARQSARCPHGRRRRAVGNARHRCAIRNPLCSATEHQRPCTLMT